jgi:hypothetical protein
VELVPVVVLAVKVAVAPAAQGMQILVQAVALVALVFLLL